MTTIAEFVDEVAAINVLTPRIVKRAEATRETPAIAPERSQLFTASWKETEADPWVIRKAKAFRRICQELPIYIREGELIVGSLTRYVRGGHAYPEWDAPLFVKAFEKTHEHTVLEDYGNIRAPDEQERKQIVEDALYWNGKSGMEKLWARYAELWGSKMKDLHDARAWHNVFNGPPAGALLDFPTLVEKGFKGIAADISRELATVQLDHAGLHKRELLLAMLICIEGIVTFARRHAQMARELAQEEPDAKRKAELDTIAETCDWVPENPARTFQEALQSMWFVQIGSMLETPSFSKCGGRIDQWAYRFYKDDVSRGRLTADEAAELLACLIVKYNEIFGFKYASVREFAMSTQTQSITIGGVTREGKDATNELSYLILEVEKQLKMPQPKLALRVHSATDENFLLKAVETMMEVAGKPDFFNDSVAILGFAQLGIPLADSRDWCPAGCIEKFIPGSSSPYRRSSMNFAKCLEMVFTNGVDRKSGKQLFPATGDPREFATFDQLNDALKKQTAYIIDAICDAYSVGLVFRGQEEPIPFHSSLTNDCIKRGLNCLEGGQRFNMLQQAVDIVGHVNVADSLAAIKKLVYEEKTVTISQLLEALQNDFQGYDKLKAQCQNAPKFGNDDDYADDFMRDIFKWTEEMVFSHNTPWGYPYGCDRRGLTAHYYFGKIIGALPDGRSAYTPLAEGSVSPMRGADKKGPSAVMNSAAKCEQTRNEGTLLNQKIMRSALKTTASKKKFIKLVRTYFDNGGYHVQFNIFDPHVLVEAKQHPEQYKDLVVRVAGFSAYFVELHPGVQDEIIARTTQDFC